MKPQKAEEVTAAPGDKSFEKLMKCLLGVRKAEFDKLRKAGEEHKHGSKLD